MPAPGTVGTDNEQRSGHRWTLVRRSAVGQRLCQCVGVRALTLRVRVGPGPLVVGQRLCVSLGPRTLPVSFGVSQCVSFRPGPLRFCVSFGVSQCVSFRPGPLRFCVSFGVSAGGSIHPTGTLRLCVSLREQHPLSVIVYALFGSGIFGICSQYPLLVLSQLPAVHQ